MSRQIIDIGVVGNDGTGDSIRDSFRKVNENFQELYSSLGLGEKLKFIGLDDTPNSYVGQYDNTTGNTPVVTTNNTDSGVTFKRLTEGSGISLDFLTNPNEIIISSAFSAISADPNPQLGGNLSARFGTNQYRIQDLTEPVSIDEAANKGYVDTKISRAGTNAVDPASGLVNQAFGRMSGPLILSRDPQPEDDETFDGLIAATKRYVDNAAFGSVSNLYVAMSGEDDRIGVSSSLQGRALAYAYRSIEAALKKAEELVLESREDLGPYKKVLTYNNGANTCTLTSITTSPLSGAGFSASALMSVDTVTLNDPGYNYYVGDILTLTGGTIATGGQSVRIEVLTTTSTPGSIVTFKVLSTGLYSAIPGATAVPSAIVTSAAPAGVPITGQEAKFDVTYKVNNVVINQNGGGSGYSLVSVRITGGGGRGAFGTAEVQNGIIVAITVTDSGSGFTSVPTVIADLPRFSIFTAGQRTDFTGDVENDNQQSYRGRDLREGLYLRGETSGALAQILAHTGELVGNDEVFDVDIKYGAFVPGEAIAYGDVTKNIQISINIESGIYEENYPLRVPQNVALIGDEFRRVIVKPRKGTSSSPWALMKFRRDTTIGNNAPQRVFDSETGQWVEEPASADLLNIATQPYGYHYLTDSTEPVLPRISNRGGSKSAATLIDLNKQFLQEEIIAWINYNILNSVSPFTPAFVYDSKLCKRDVGFIVDAISFDLKYGGYARTISAGLKYFQNASALIAINEQLTETLAAIDQLKSLIQTVIQNNQVSTPYSGYTQIIDNAYIAESGSAGIINDLFTVLKTVMQDDASVNKPKNNDQMDVFLCNDAVIVRAITAQGHGGFMMTLDPEGQILAKSPYAQECASFSKSINSPTFAGGQFIDGFAGNLQFKHEATIAGTNNTRLSVSGLDRIPNLPASFIVGDTVHRINYVRDYIYNPAGSTATFVLDETTPFTRTPGQQSCTINVGNPTNISATDHLLQIGSTIVFSTTGTLPSGIVAGKEYYVISDGLTNNSFRVSDEFGSPVPIATTGSSGTHSYQRIYEVLMPGNRSMLANDFTQINDLGFGIIATNGGLAEAVSMFTYYCHISYYSLNGGQIRSVGGSSAHGNYALVAQGSDPLEVPTPTDLYYDLSQRVICYFPSSAYANNAGGLIIYVTGFNYTPLNNSELEVDHGGVIFRYPVTSVAVEGMPVDPINGAVCRLNLTSDSTGNFDGLFKSIPDGAVMTLRMNSQIILTGDLVDVAVRPSTGLVLKESPEVYRVLQFEDYNDPNAPYVATISNGGGTNPAIVSFKITITDIIANECTTANKHNLIVGDVFVPDNTSQGFTAGLTYYVTSVSSYNKFTLSLTQGGNTVNLISGNNLNVTGKRSHKMRANYQVRFTTQGTLPAPILTTIPYYVLEENLTETEFKISVNKNGAAVSTNSAGLGLHFASPAGLTRTTLRENYNYVDLTVWQPGEFVSIGYVCTISIGDPATISLSNHGFSVGDVIKFETTGALPSGLTTQRNYHIISDGFTTQSFRVSQDPDIVAGRAAVATFGTQSGVHTVGIVKGRIGDTQIPVVPVSPDKDALRVVGTKFVFLGREYIITNYENETITNKPYARITIDRGLQNSIIKYSGSYTIKAGVPIRSTNAEGDLTIRISLTRVTSHDLLDIGTGSYADTNYPNEIYGPPVNSINDQKETEERDVGRVFYVTTDQYGNFRVGPYFRVDQGTGRVTFSAAIALSNLDGIGFKRGVPIAEFSTDSSFSDNATDTVPTENATRIYLERRLGITHTGSVVPSGQLIPSNTGGFLSLDGQLAMKSNLDMGTSQDHKIINLADPSNPYDAVNLRSLKVANISDFSFNDVDAGDIVIMTGTSNEMTNAEFIGDLNVTYNSQNKTLDLQIKSGAIANAEVSANAAIDQSKLNMSSAQGLASATGITQANKGLAAFDNSQFTVTDGWATIKENGLARSRIEKVSGKNVLGNSSSVAANVSEVAFTTVVSDGGAIKKGQYTAVGFLRRINTSSSANDSDYEIVNSSAAYTGTSDDGKLIIRDSNGGFESAFADLGELRINGKLVIDDEATATGGYTRILGYNNTGGIYLNDGTLAGDKTTQYWNDAHVFKTQNGLNNAPITASTVRCTAITTGGNTTSGTITGRWTLTGTSPNESRLQATYSADLAEYYEGDKEYEVGTVLVFGGDKEVTLTDRVADRRVAGVVSNTAAFVMYDACPGHKNLVALQGRVPVKVVGKISKGDILVTSDIPGVAQAAGDDVRVGTMIGKALENYDSTEIGTIEVAVGRT